MNSESPQKQLSVGIWAIIIASLVLSGTAIMLHLTKVMENIVDRTTRYGADAYQVQMQLNQTKAELAKLQADIAAASSFSQLKKSQGMPVGTSFTPPGSTLEANRASSPGDAVTLLEQAVTKRSFDEYQEAQPAPQRKLLEEIYQSNRELRLAYQALLAKVEGRFAEDEVLGVLNENEAVRLMELLFPRSRRYEVLKVINSSNDKAVMNVRVFTIRESPGNDVPESVRETQLNGMIEGTWWKVADDAQTQAEQKAILTKLQEQARLVNEMTRQVLDGKIKNKEEFRQAWEALPMNKKY